MYSCLFCVYNCCDLLFERRKGGMDMGRIDDILKGIEEIKNAATTADAKTVAERVNGLVDELVAEKKRRGNI